MHGHYTTHTHQPPKLRFSFMGPWGKNWALKGNNFNQSRWVLFLSKQGIPQRQKGDKTVTVIYQGQQAENRECLWEAEIVGVHAMNAGWRQAVIFRRDVEMACDMFGDFQKQTCSPKAKDKIVHTLEQQSIFQFFFPLLWGKKIAFISGPKKSSIPFTGCKKGQPNRELLPKAGETCQPPGRSSQMGSFASTLKA